MGDTHLLIHQLLNENYLEDDDNISNDKASNPTIPESHEQDTSLHHSSPSNHQTQPQDELATILEEEEQEVEEQPDPADQDTLVFESEESEEEPFNTAIDTTSDDSAITMDKPVQGSSSRNSVEVFLVGSPLVFLMSILNCWGMLCECTLRSYRVLHFYQRETYNYNTCC